MSGLSIRNGRRGRPERAFLAVLIVAVALLAAACTSSGSMRPGPATAAATTSPAKAVVPPATPAGAQFGWLIAAMARLPVPDAQVRAHFDAAFLAQVAAVSDASPTADRTDAVWVVNAAVAAERLIWAGDLTVIWPPEPVFIRLHPVVLRGMTANLLDNATRAAGPSGTVTVEVTRAGSRMRLAVDDDGPGFGGFVRGEGTGKGHGFGLSAVARQASQRGGRLECGRSSLGGGRVSLWLPLEASRTERKRTGATCPV